MFCHIRSHSVETAFCIRYLLEIEVLFLRMNCSRIKSANRVASQFFREQLESESLDGMSEEMLECGKLGLLLIERESGRKKWSRPRCC